MAGDQVQRLLEHRAALNGIDRISPFEPPLELFDQGAFA